jgi:hypothetical protein
VYGIRYHIVTLCAVFLALGLGLLLGGTIGEEYLVKEQVDLLTRLEDRYKQAKEDNSLLQKKSAEWERRHGELEQATALVGRHYVRDRLIGRKIALIQLEEGDVEPLKRTLEQSGAMLTLAANLQQVHLLHADAQKWRELQGQLGFAPEHAPDAKSVCQRLAAVLVRELFFAEQTPLATRLKEQGVLDWQGASGVRPDHVIVVGGASERSLQRLQMFDVPLLLTLSEAELATVGVERSDVYRSGVPFYMGLGISTVDNIDQVTGRVALVDVLGGARGHYGTKKTAEALLPQATTAKEVSSP